MMERYLGI